MKRRDFLTTAAATTAAGLLGGCNDSDRQAIDYSKHPSKRSDENKDVHVNRNRKTKITLATSWPAHFPIMGTGVDRFAENVNRASGGSLEIKVYPKNTLIPALAVFDAASSGQIDAFHSGPYYWKGKNSAFSLFSGSPFGMTAEEINSWMLYGNGMTLWRKLYAKNNLYPLLGGNTNIQMGGWYRKPIESLSDMQGLKMRIPGLGGEVYAKMGVNPVLLSAGEIYSALERGVIDASEWVGPALDLKMGFYKVAPYYYSGFHEPGSVLELTFNQHKWKKLSGEHQAIIEMASAQMNADMASEFHYENMKALETLKTKGIEIHTYPEDVVAAAKTALVDVLREQSALNGDFREVSDDIAGFLAQSKAWSKVSLHHFLNIRE
ncbi:MAG: TRAP transporter substrate-binding protein DctP [Thiovulaceae bacterium]|nr:TRAP transporter substrate-binding protein DctP [Sulfurimonadaceae bacterium]